VIGREYDDSALGHTRLSAPLDAGEMHHQLL
jgi:hypothetical protein